METIAKGRTSQALDKIMDLPPSQARLVQDYDAPSDDKGMIVRKQIFLFLFGQPKKLCFHRHATAYTAGLFVYFYFFVLQFPKQQ